MDLHDRAIVITGASRGLGRALAHELGARGARLLLVARSAGEVEAAAASVRAAGGQAGALAADVGAKDAIHRISGAAGALLGDVDVLVHNAGTLGPEPLALLVDTACEDLQRALEVNVLGPFRLTKALVGGMLLRGEGLVAHVSSDAALHAYLRWGAYGASKAALDHLARTFAVELEGTGVRFLAIDPGEMDTAMHAAAVPDADRTQLQRPADVARRIAAVLADGAVRSGSRIDLVAGRVA
jgi:NAD(P)-dependent dehydrogenase (short-subunit alcohol dehydrogenase family)